MNEIKTASAIILAAGDGKRMNSAKPKALMNVLFQPMLGWVMDSVEDSGIEQKNITVIVGSNSEQVINYLDSRGNYRHVYQHERKGTGHAVMQAEDILRGDLAGDVLILCGDAPFMNKETISAAYDLHKKEDNDLTVITAKIEPAGNYGRVKRDLINCRLTSIIEMSDCSPEELLINEVNSGAYWFKTEKLLQALPQLKNNNSSGEFYLTDTVMLLNQKAGSYMTDDAVIVLGANDRKQLRRLNEIMAEKIYTRHYTAGVDIIGHNVIIGKDVKIARDTLIMPNTIIKGKTEIGIGCVIGPNTQIDNCVIGENVVLNSVQAFDSTIEDSVKAGPFVHIRPGTILRKGVKIGDFVEVKNSEIGENTALAHLTYIGDSDVGNSVNFGCGCVTANYDGLEKYRTLIGDNAFIGCNTNLIAPVKIGANAAIAAGSTISKDVPDNALAIERAQVNIKENWYKNKLRLKKK
ncbi:MAG: bifunctional UDP-N-acetylglucosamine diphosphorylase/glucosamine-1-phosphate N-acetyltransferase GlmU [Eubacterium sp.]|jgi:bifunctional UDP-N-acetylglucosamine pyrophosphorylase/glucosamine-1-phosphate N-acetyltransferase|nr:bifunctional UDP-N-acetylglucosamine diphosphorylase/glucosamine-1-phosphate N-acetyltransferase GlmU [Eubacterium sp.]